MACLVAHETLINMPKLTKTEKSLVCKLILIDICGKFIIWQKVWIQLGSKYVGTGQIYDCKGNLLSIMSHYNNKNINVLFRCSWITLVCIFEVDYKHCSNFKLSRSTRNVFCCPHKKFQCIIAKVRPIRSIITQKHTYHYFQWTLITRLIFIL